MSFIIIFIFLLAALLGVFLISYIFRNKNTPKGVAMVHGFIAALGIILLVIYVFMSPSKPIVSLVLFILAAFGGFTMMYRDIMGKSLPKWLAAGHGFIAIIAFLLLIVAIYL